RLPPRRPGGFEKGQWGNSPGRLPQGPVLPEGYWSFVIPPLLKILHANAAAHWFHAQSNYFYLSAIPQKHNTFFRRGKRADRCGGCIAAASSCGRGQSAGR